MSRLSSLLVRDGLVGVKRMEKAFQRQVIYGGALDTILLEINAVPEERLTQYLALASGLPPAARDEGRTIDLQAVGLLPADLAEQFRAVPLSLAGDALRVLVCAPLELAELEDLADLLDRPLQPLITPEYRWHLAYSAAYATETPARFTTLARTLEIESSPEAVGRAKTIIVDGVPAHDTQPLAMEQRTPAPAKPMPARAPTPAAGIANVEPPPDLPSLSRRPTPPRVPAAVGADAPTMRINRHQQTLVGITAQKDFVEDPGERSVPLVGAAIAAPPEAVPLPIEKRIGSAPIVTTGRDSPLAIVRARDMLATAEDRDTVFLTLLRATRARARYAGLLTVQGGAAIGRVALAEPSLDTSAIASVLIPLDVVSPFRSVAHNQQPHIGSLASSDAGIDAMMLRLGGAVPPSALLMPIVLRDRVVAIVIAHRGHGELKLVDVAELLPLASAAADALSRLIVMAKRAAPQAEVDGDQNATGRMHIPMGFAGDDEPELSFVADPDRPIDLVLDGIEAAREGGAEELMFEAVERSRETLGALMRRFPGTLRVDRFAVSGRPLRAAQYGGLLDLAVRLGAAASELLVEQMASAQRDTRFYATICTAELRPRSAIIALVERLFDQDFGVRAAAIEGLAGYPVAELTQSLARARRAVHSSDPEVVAAAVTAIVSLGDIEAVGDLIAALERNDKGTEHVRKALVALTAQDFGASERKWRKWWDAAKSKHRIEWLIDGLTHKEDANRETAIQELRRLTGEYFGYHHDLPRKERDIAAERWIAWWREIGHRRFVVKDDERHRPTAVLPGRLPQD
ncbi:MAG TPA: hypothetical protein VH143_29770 [Kofleriaceae bacterium]|jgi:hypothetical protein|nr:hypothetical protein [Kofleriaceae bacterium]